MAKEAHIGDELLADVRWMVAGTFASQQDFKIHLSFWMGFFFLSFFFFVQWVLFQHWSISPAVYKYWYVPLVELERGWLEARKTIQLTKFVKHVNLLTFCPLRQWAFSLFIVCTLWIFVIKPEMGIVHPPFSYSSTDTFSEVLVALPSALTLTLFISDVLHVNTTWFIKKKNL